MNEHENKAVQDCFWVVVPAAGIGKRMSADKPKQYLPLAGGTVMQQTFDCLLTHPRIEGLVAVVSETDPYWMKAGYTKHPSVIVAQGGRERFHSVLNGLEVLAQVIPKARWVMVHDVARPCITHADLDSLIDATATATDGVVLGAPVRDTMKQTDPAGMVSRTVERADLWHAFTPQVFRLGRLREALQQSVREDKRVTDESSVMEMMGYRPRMIEGKETNIKITRPDDLLLAEFILQRVRGEPEDR